MYGDGHDCEISKVIAIKTKLALYGRNHVRNIRIFNNHYNCLTKSPHICLLNQPFVFMINNVGLPFGLSNIDHNNNISNVGLHLVSFSHCLVYCL